MYPWEKEGEPWRKKSEAWRKEWAMEEGKFANAPQASLHSQLSSVALNNTAGIMKRHNLIQARHSWLNSPYPALPISHLSFPPSFLPTHYFFPASTSLRYKCVKVSGKVINMKSKSLQYLNNEFKVRTILMGF